VFRSNLGRMLTRLKVSYVTLTVENTRDRETSLIGHSCSPFTISVRFPGFCTGYLGCVGML
jgi:hypothetical protein